MENKDDLLKGIYYKTLENGDIFNAAHVPTLIKQLQQIQNSKGWANWIQKPLDTPHEKGYTFKPVINKRFLKNMEGTKDKSGEVLTSN